MAQVSFTISAIDRTRAAFASINQRLRVMDQSVKGLTSSRGVVGLGLKFAGVGTILGAVAGRARYLHDNLSAITGIPDSAVDSVDLLKNQMSGLIGVVDRVILGWTKGIPDAIQLARYQFDRLTKGEDEAAKMLLERERQALEAMRNAPEYIKRQEKEQELLNKALKEFGEIGETSAQKINRVRQESEALMARSKGTSDPITGIKLHREAIELRTAAERDYHKLLAENTKLTREAGIANMAMVGATVPLKDRIEGLEAAWARTSKELADYAGNTPQALEKQNEVLKEQRTIANALTKAYDEQNQVAREAGMLLARGFEDAAMSGGKLRDVVQGLASDLLRMMLRNAVTTPLAGYLGDIFSGKKLKGNAFGGAVSAGTPYIVGENGPELFVSSQAGRIIPNHDMQGSGGGGPSVSVNFAPVFQTGVTRQEVAALIPRMIESAKMAVADAVGRGGAYRKSFA